MSFILRTSSETQGQIKGVRESLNGRKNIYKTKKSKERQEEPLGTMSYQTSSKRSLPFWLLIGVFFWHQSEARTAATVWNWCGKTLSPGALLAVLYFSSFHIIIFFRPFRLFLIPTICPWVSEDVLRRDDNHSGSVFSSVSQLYLANSVSFDSLRALIHLWTKRSSYKTNSTSCCNTQLLHLAKDVLFVNLVLLCGDVLQNPGPATLKCFK